MKKDSSLSRCSMNDSMIGVYKEDNENNNKESFLNNSNEKEDEINNNEEMEELSDIMKKSDYDDDDDDYDDTYGMISDNDSRKGNNIYYNNNYNNRGKERPNFGYSENDDEEDNIVRRRTTNDDIKCCSDLDKHEPDIDVNIKEGFTQMVNKNIKKVINLPYYVNNEMIEVLMIAEKPSLAKTITRILSDDNYRSYYNEPITIYTFKKLFQGKKAFYTVTSIRGHIYQDCFRYRDDYDDDNIDINDLYEEKMVKILKNIDDEEKNKNKDKDRTKKKRKKKINIPLFLRKIAEGKDILCLWLDCDPEGENICYEVIHNVYPNMNKRNYQQIYRAKFNSLTETDIKHSFENLSDYPNKKLSMSVDARSIIDFKVGVCFTRLFSSRILPYLDKIREFKHILSYGPCQTPTLWFCVKRLKERKKYIPSSYYQIYIEIENDEGETYRLTMNKKFDDKDRMLKRFNKIRCNFFATLEKTTYRKKKLAPPAGLKTTTMLKMASLQLGLSPFNASKEAQKLYMNGLISYPRTKSTKYSENFDFKRSLNMFTNNPHFSEKVKDLLNNFDIKNVDFSRGEEKGGHEPIIPTDSTTQEHISNNLNWDLYRCICLYYFASVSPPMEYENMEYKFSLGKYKLKLTQSKLIKKGFLTFLPLKNKHFVEEFPSFKENQDYKIVNIDYEKRRYSAPELLTEAELINEMEKKHIGTDGSIPSHIKNLTNRGYVKVNEHRRIRPTKLGVVLIDALNKVVPEIVKPENRAKIEEFVKQIETGEKNFDEAIEKALSFYKEKLKCCIGKIDKIKNEFGQYFNLVGDQEKQLKLKKRNK